MERNHNELWVLIPKNEKAKFNFASIRKARNLLIMATMQEIKGTNNKLASKKEPEKRQLFNSERRFVNLKNYK